MRTAAPLVSNLSSSENRPASTSSGTVSSGGKPARAAATRFGVSGSTPDKPSEPDFLERFEAMAKHAEDLFHLATDALQVVQKGVVAGVKVLKNLPGWESLLSKAETLASPDAKNDHGVVNRIQSVVDVAIAEFRNGYKGKEGATAADPANFALYKGVLTRFPDLLRLTDNDKVKTVLEGVAQGNPAQPAEETLRALEALTSSPKETPLTAADVEKALNPDIA